MSDDISATFGPLTTMVRLQWSIDGTSSHRALISEAPGRVAAPILDAGRYLHNAPRMWQPDPQLTSLVEALRALPGVAPRPGYSPVAFRRDELIVNCAQGADMDTVRDQAVVLLEKFFAARQSIAPVSS